MKDLFGQTVCDPLPTPLTGTAPCAAKVFFVASWYSPDMRWKIWKEREWINRDAAVKWATTELVKIRGHTHYAILECCLPGIETL